MSRGITWLSRVIRATRRFGARDGSARYSAISAVMAALLAGCATSPVTLSDRYVSTAPLTAHPAGVVIPSGPAAPVGCETTLGAISDKRLDSSTIGRVAGRTIKSPPDMAKWIASAFGTLACSVGCTASSRGKNAPAVVLEVDLLKAWMSSINSDVATNLVFKVRYVRANVVLEESVYRGRDTSGNFASAQDELQQDFDVSMSHVLDQVHRDLANVCAARAIS